MWIWCVFIHATTGESFHLRLHTQDYRKYVNWPGRFYRYVDGGMIPIIFEDEFTMNKHWQDTLPDR